MDNPGLTVHDLRAEYEVNPLGIDAARPRLSWVVASTRRNQAQSAWRVLVARSRETLDRDEGDLWDSGRVEDDRTAHVAYGGPALASRQRAWWKVMAWDTGGVASGWSPAAWWEMGLLAATDWQAAWIGLPGIAPDTTIPEAAELDGLLPVTLVRRTFAVDRAVTSARLYATARGVYEARLNGERIGDQALAPGWTDYHHRIQVQAFDVTTLLAPGENVLAVEVAAGWYCGYVGWRHQCRHYGTTPQVLLQLHVDFADGGSEVITSDGQWLASTGPTRYADLLMGEYHDARLETGWDRPGFDASGWLPVQTAPTSAVPLVAECGPPVRGMEEIAPVAVTEPLPGTFIFDLGQNIAGRARLRVRGASGTIVRLRHAEILDPDGTLYITNLRTARATDTYILRGGQEEVFEPRFTWHGFRYVEVSGYPGVPARSAITGVFVGSDTTPAGGFRCSDALVNQLQDNIVRGQRGNFLSVPTDCPQRDERLGWLGDAQVFIGTAVGNMDVATFFTKWMRDVADAQLPTGAIPDVAPRLADLAGGAPAWADCGVIVPWTIWKTYGDTRIIDEHWPAMERWMAWLVERNPDHRWRADRGNDFGDWLAIGANTPKELIGTAYWAYDARLMTEMATALGRDHDAVRYRDLEETIAAGFRADWLAADDTITAGTQTACCLALHFDLVDASQRPMVAAQLVADIEARGGHLSTGFVGVSYLCHVLTANAYPEVAYRLLHQEGFPGWKYSILHGATTIWERWDGWTEATGFRDPGMNSFNHYSLGSVGEWLRTSVAGIGQQPGTCGYHAIRISPRLDDSLQWAEGWFGVMSGVIRSHWERVGRDLALSVTIPANARAEVIVPASDGAVVTEGGVPVEDHPDIAGAVRDSGLARIAIGSGEWSFLVTPG